MNTTEWLKSHKQEAMLGAGGIVVALALYVRSKNSSSSAGASGAPESYAMPTSTADTTGTDVYNGLEDQILGLQQAVLAMGPGGSASGAGSGSGAGAGAGAPSGPPAASSANSVLQGTLGAYGDPTDVTLEGLDNNAYTPFTSWAGAQAYLASGGQLYYEPTLGNFEPASKGGALSIPGGTGSAVYQRVGS